MRNSKRRAAGALALGLGVVLALSACDPTDSGSQPFNDAPVDKSVGSGGVQSGPGVIVNMPDGFNNVVYKCVKNPDGTWTMFTTLYHSTSAYGAVAVTEHAALCGK
jgi:hypothetical protein